MASVSHALAAAYGLRLSDEGLTLLSSQLEHVDADSIFQLAIDTNLKEIGAPVFPDPIRGVQRLPGIVLLQVSSARNISAPSIRQHDQQHPRMLGVTLTDGHAKCQAVEYSPIKEFNLKDLLPGTKIIVRDLELVDGVALLTAEHVVRICGRVESIARAQQMKDQAATLRQRMFRASLEEGEEPPPTFTLLQPEVAQPITAKTQSEQHHRPSKHNRGDTRQERPSTATARLPSNQTVAAAPEVAPSLPQSLNQTTASMSKLSVQVDNKPGEEASGENARRQFSGAQIVHRGRATAFSADAFQRKKAGEEADAPDEPDDNRHGRFQRRGRHRRDDDDGVSAAAAAAQEAALAHLPPIEKLMSANPGYRLKLSCLVNEINLAVVDRETCLMFSFSDLEMTNMFVAAASKPLFLDLMGLGSNMGFNAANNTRFMQSTAQSLSSKFTGFEVDIEATVVTSKGNIVLTHFDTGAPPQPSAAAAPSAADFFDFGHAVPRGSYALGDASDPMSLASSRGRGRGRGRGRSRGRF